MESRAGTTRLPGAIACDQGNATGFLVGVNDLGPQRTGMDGSW